MRVGERVVSLVEPFAVVGRHIKMDIRVDGLDVSQRHAYFQLIGGRLFCVDLGSQSGTHWPDGPLTWGWVGSGCKVRIGDHEVGPDPGDGEDGLGAGTVEPPMPTSRSFASFEEPAALCLQGKAGAGTSASWRVNRALVLIGRSPCCKVRLTGRDALKVHAAVLREDNRAWIVDLRTPAGVLVNGTRFRARRLDDGDEVGIGQDRFLWLYGPSAAGVSSGENLPALWSLQRPPLAVSQVFPFDVPDALQIPPQLRQAMTMLVKVFEAMQREQFDLFRHELARMQRTLEPAAPVEAPSKTRYEGADQTPASPPPPSPPLILPTVPPQATPKLDLFERAEALRTLQTPAWGKLVEALTGGNLGAPLP